MKGKSKGMRKGQLKEAELLGQKDETKRNSFCCVIVLSFLFLMRDKSGASGQ